MLVRILGSAALGGFPQWNCAGPNCKELRSGPTPGRPRTHSQFAFSPVEGIWFLIGASPELRTQILSAGPLAPTPDASSPIAGLFLPSADLEEVEGLLQLVDLDGAFLFATTAVQRILKTESRLFNAFTSRVQWQAISARRRIGCHLSDNPGDPPTFFYSAITLGGSFPDYVSEDIRRNCSPEETRVGFLFEQADKKLFLAPKIEGGSSEWLKIAESADVAVLDSNLWRNLVEHFPKGTKGRRILTSLHHESPLLDEKSEEYRAAVEAGFEIAYDGLEIRL
ncbi:MAG TPA: MBL fold metallo-hydrolase [Dongiaceae bacterium]|nr:MBL fold metallo-hydrolase [Dongiaceae bacterium]